MGDARPVMDLAGKRFGIITVVSLSHVNKNSYWNCRCDCGTEFVAIGNNIKRGKSKSCGCLRRQVVGDKWRTHGDTGTRLYRIWANMKRRSLNKNEPRYKDYGGRGISICERWLEYKNFKADMHRSYVSHCEAHGECNTTIDRIDNSGDYCLENCRWTTYAEQSLNRRVNNVLVFEGKEYCLIELSRRFNINRSTLKDRINKGWSVGKAVFTPVKNQGGNR